MASITAAVDTPAPYDLTTLETKYRINAYNVHSSTAISSRTATVLNALFPGSDAGTPSASSGQAASHDRNQGSGQESSGPASLNATHAVDDSTSSVIQSGPIAPPASDALPSLVVLTAQAKAANKLISIVEIIKREARKADPGRKVFQYSELTAKMMEIPRNPRPGATGHTVPAPRPRGNGDDAVGHDGGTHDGDEKEPAFQTMPEPGPTTKLRQTPVMTIYLATKSVRELKLTFG
jgi:hypothetical protein